MYALDTKEQIVRDKEILSELQNFAQNWLSVWLKMNWSKLTPLFEKDTK